MLLSHVLPLSHNLEICRVVFLSCYAYSVVSLPHNTECCIIQLCRVILLSHNTECCIIQLCRVISLSHDTECCIIQLCRVISLSHNTECCIIQLCRVISLSCCTYGVISLSHNTECCTVQLCRVVLLLCYTYSALSLSHNTEGCITQLCRVVSLSCYTYSVFSLSHIEFYCMVSWVVSLCPIWVLFPYSMTLIFVLYSSLGILLTFILQCFPLILQCWFLHYTALQDYSSAGLHSCYVTVFPLFCPPQWKSIEPRYFHLLVLIWLVAEKHWSRTTCLVTRSNVPIQILRRQWGRWQRICVIRVLE